MARSMALFNSRTLPGQEKSRIALRACDESRLPLNSGSFTGAHARKIGKFEQADGGTIFLDEIGELNLDLQAKLLRALQNREITRVGGNDTITFDARVISATNKDIIQMIRGGTFREDLYYRLFQFPIQLPPLRERAPVKEPFS